VKFGRKGNHGNARTVNNYLAKLEDVDK